MTPVGLLRSSSTGEIGIACLSDSRLGTSYVMDAVQLRRNDGSPAAAEPVGAPLSSLARVLLASLDDKALDQLAEMLAPRLARAVAQPAGVLLTPNQAAELLSVHPKTLTRAAAAGRVRGAVRVGRAWRFAAGELALGPPVGAVGLTATSLRQKPVAGQRAAASIRAAGASALRSGRNGTVRATQR